MAPKKNDDDAVVELTTLDDEQLQGELDAAIASFNELAERDSVSEEEILEMRALADRADEIRTEQDVRKTRAEEAAEEIADLTERVHGRTQDASDGDADGDDDTSGGDADGDDDTSGGDADGDDDTSGGSEDERVSVAASRRPLNLSSVRARQRAPEPPTRRSGVVITASSDVPGIDTGQQIDMDQLSDAVHKRARGIATKSGKPAARALVASYALPFDEVLVVDSDGNASEGTRAVMAAADQSRLPGGDIAASGGWCAPSETVYDIADVACPDLLWSPPEVQLRRGGLRFFQTPTLDVSGLTFEWTEEDDEAAPGSGTKDCFAVPCPDPVEVRCVAVGACIESGLLTERAFPELVSWYTRNALVAHEIAISRRAFNDAIAAGITQSIVTTATFAAFTAVFGAVALQSADMIEKHSLCEATSVEVVFPWWFKNLALADIARQNGRALSEIDPAVLRTAFASLGVLVSFARSLPPDVPAAIGGADVPLGWPDAVPFLMFPAGGFQLGRGMAVDLGVVQDSAKFATNDFTALFTEECVATLPRGPEARYVTVPVCPDGATGAQVTVECPIDGGELES